MFEVNVPVMLSTMEYTDRAALLQQLRSLDATRVFLALGNYTTDPEKLEAICKTLREEAVFFHREGFEVGCWLWSIDIFEKNDFIHMADPNGEVDENAVCPSDERFLAFAGNYVEQLAKTGVDMILYDDDFRYGFRLHGGMGCFCKNHRAYMEKLLKKPLPADLTPFISAGGANEYRSASFKAKRYYFEQFARKIREAVDRVNPAIRFGLCACLPTWDQDGISADEIARLLAGNTKPYLRLIGAPYWAARKSFKGSRLQYVIEYERMEYGWIERPEELEIVAEGDPYCRPRYACPANYLEGFDMALRADGKLNGILKYGVDYTSPAPYENGYVERHLRNKETYRILEEVFAPKTACGIRIREAKNIYENAEIPESVAGKGESQYLFFSSAAKLFSTLSFPTTHTGKGMTNAAFGENAKYLGPEAFEGGLILDARGARYLQEKGVDVGLNAWGEPRQAEKEFFPAQNVYTPTYRGLITPVTLKEGAEPDSYYQKEGESFPAAYRYVNAEGQRFFVLCFDAFFNDERIWRQYAKARQIAAAVEWLAGKKLPAHIVGAPDLYLMAKEDGGKMAVGLWNFFADDVLEPVVTLDRAYTSLKVWNGSGTLEGDQVKLSRIEPFGYTLFEVE